MAEDLPLVEADRFYDPFLASVREAMQRRRNNHDITSNEHNLPLEIAAFNERYIINFVADLPPAVRLTADRGAPFMIVRDGQQLPTAVRDSTVQTNDENRYYIVGRSQSNQGWLLAQPWRLPESDGSQPVLFLLRQPTVDQLVRRHQLSELAIGQMVGRRQLHELPQVDFFTEDRLKDYQVHSMLGTLAECFRRQDQLAAHKQHHQQQIAVAKLQDGGCRSIVSLPAQPQPLSPQPPAARRRPQPGPHRPRPF